MRLLLRSCDCSFIEDVANLPSLVFLLDPFKSRGTTNSSPRAIPHLLPRWLRPTKPKCSTESLQREQAAHNPTLPVVRKLKRQAIDNNRSAWRAVLRNLRTESLGEKRQKMADFES